MKSYISVEIFRNGSDCTNNGVSSPEKSSGKIFLVPCAGGNWKEDEVLDNPDRFVVLEIKEPATNMHLRPVSAGGAWTMFGGNFAWTSDSRFRKSVSENPLRIHDRIEG